MNKIGKILSYEQLETNISSDIQDNFTSACAYFDVKRIAKYLDPKLIPNLQHFYILITAYVGVKQRINDGKYKRGWDVYGYYPATGTSLDCNYQGYESKMSYRDFSFKYMVNELLHVIGLFVKNGFICDKNVYKVLIFLNIDIEPISHLFTLSKKEQQDVTNKYKDIYAMYIAENHKSKTKISEKELKTKNQATFEKICASYTLGTILAYKLSNKKIVYTNSCVRSSVFNRHTEVLEFFCSYGYVPSLDDINLISKIDRRFVLLLRFYPNILEDQNDYEKINNALEKDDNIMKMQAECAIIKQKEKDELVVCRVHYENKQQIYVLCEMYDPSKLHKNKVFDNIPKLIFEDNLNNGAESNEDKESDSDDEVLVKKRK